MDFKLLGDARQDRDFLTLLQDSPIKVGAHLSHSDYDALKSKIRNLALEKGYFNGKFETSRIEVLPIRNQANIILHYNSSRGYHFGQALINGSQIDPNRILFLKNFSPGEPYRLSAIRQFSQNLTDSGWFSSVLVEPDFSDLDNQTDLPVNVTLVPAAKNKLETGIGYSTDVGIRGTLKWNKP